MKSAIAACLTLAFLLSPVSPAPPAHAASDAARAGGLLGARDAGPALRCRRIQRAAQTMLATKGHDASRVGSERRIAKKPRRLVRKFVGAAYERAEVTSGCYRCIARQIKRGVPVEEQVACGLHDPCVAGCALDPALDPCAADVCDTRVSCCSSAWDEACVGAAADVCNLECEPCSHDVCEVGFALDPSCSDCAAAICESDPFCCDTLWSDECVSKVEVVCGIDCLAGTTTTISGGTTTTLSGGTSTTISAGETTTTIAGASTTTTVAGATTTTLPPGRCVEKIDFDEPPPGTVVSDIETAQGTIVVKGTNPKLGAAINAAVLFDSTCARPDGDRIDGRDADECTGGDDDLGSPNEDFGGPGVGAGGASGQSSQNDASLGNVLIVASDLIDKDGNGLVDDPDDQGVRRVLRELDFSALAPVSVLGMTVLDIDADDLPAHVELFDAVGASLGKFDIPETGNNGVAELELPPNQGVWKLVVSIKGSSAIDNLRISCPDGTTTTVPATTTTVPQTTTTVAGSTTTVPQTTTTVPATTTTVAASTTTMPDTTTTLPDTTTTVEQTTTTLIVTTTVRETTTTLPETTTTTSTTTSTTSTTLPPVLGFECDVTIGITSIHSGIGALQLEVLYDGIVGGFKGEQFGVACTSNVGGQLFDDDAAKKLSQSTISSGGFDAPTTTAQCKFETNTDALSPGDFALNLIAASDLSLNDLTPALAVTAVECAPAVEAVVECTLRVDVSNATDALTALQISTDYSAAPAGGFPKNPCVLGPTGGVTDLNDDRVNEKLTIGYANNASSFAGPATFATCKYRVTDGDTPVAGDFPVTVDDASEGAPIPTPASPVPTLGLAVQSCAEVDPACGNGVVEPGETCDDGNVAPGDGCDATCSGA